MPFDTDTGFEVGTGLGMTVLDGCLLLTPEGEKVKWQRAQAQQLRRLAHLQAALHRARKQLSRTMG